MLHEALAAYLEIAIARNTVHQMLGFLDDCFLVRVVLGERLSSLPAAPSKAGEQPP